MTKPYANGGSLVPQQCHHMKRADFPQFFGKDHLSTLSAIETLKHLFVNSRVSARIFVFGYLCETFWPYST